MAGRSQIWCVVLMCLASLAVGGRVIAQEGACKSPKVKTATYLTPPMTARPGQVNNKYYRVTEFPKGHLGIKTVNAELVYHTGESVPQYDMYLHHFVLDEYFVPKLDSQRHVQHLLKNMGEHHSYFVSNPRHNKLQDTTATLPGFVHRHSKGAESRNVLTRLPGPYVFETGKEIEGFETVWILNVHSLDTRGAVQAMGCVQCRCNLYNVTSSKDGRSLPEGYWGGNLCCGDGQQCALQEGFNGDEITFHLKYTFEYVDWNDCLIPITEFTLDITNPDNFSEDLVEFTLEGCGDADPSSAECIDTKVSTFIFPVEGDFVFAISHQHPSSISASLWGEDGRLICSSTPIMGEGHEAGNEKGYVVGITSCYGKPGTADAVKIKQGEKLKFVARYSKVGGPRTGLMSLMRFVVATDGAASAIY